MEENSLTNKYKVFILLATFNRAHLVKETLESIKNQTYEDWECIIIDDFSTDNSLEVIKNFIKDDSRFSLFIKNEKYAEGLSGSRNYGLDIANKLGAKYVQFFDDDDIVHPLNLEISIKEIIKGNYNFCRYIRHAFSQEFHYNFDFSKEYSINKFDHSVLEKMITGEIRFNSCQVLWELDCFQNDRFDETLHYAEEWEVFQRILSKGLKGINVEKVLYFARKHPQSNTGEFWGGNKLREQSNIKSITLVIDNLYKKDLLSKTMVRHFFQLSVFYKSKIILNHLLNKLDKIKNVRYRIFFILYPVMSFLYKQKVKIKSNFKK